MDHRVLQHINDTERIMSYRALRFARNDKTLLPGYDENYFVEHSNANERSLEALKEEFILLRKSAINMYESFNEESLLRRGICFNVDLSVLALGFILAGHQIHHMKVMQEKYYFLADNQK
ncbi:MAG: DinB family protein [Bacteroidetes bacterium]|nr:DinB family protein [Bacteroidota bacterium]